MAGKGFARKENRLPKDMATGIPAPYKKVTYTLCQLLLFLILFTASQISHWSMIHFFLRIS